jgi:hypothetical protein
VRCQCPPPSSHGTGALVAHGQPLHRIHEQTSQSVDAQLERQRDGRPLIAPSSERMSVPA